MYRQNEESKTENRTVVRDSDRGGGLTAKLLLFLHFYEHLFKFKPTLVQKTDPSFFCLSAEHLVTCCSFYKHFKWSPALN